MRIKEIWTVNEVAEYLQLSKSFVYKAASSGRLPSFKLGCNVLRFEAESIRKWFKEQK